MGAAMATCREELVTKAYARLRAAHFGKISKSTRDEYRIVSDRIQAARLAAGDAWAGPKSIASSKAYQTVCRSAWARRTHYEVACALRDLNDRTATPEEVRARLQDWLPEAEAYPPIEFHFDPEILRRRPGRPAIAEQPHRSKRHALHELPPDWMGRLWHAAADDEHRHLDGIAVLMVTGCRPAEASLGVVVRRVPDGVEVEVTGVKVWGSAGQAWRRLTVAEDCDGPSAHLARVADRAPGGVCRVEVNCTPAAISMAVAALGRSISLPRAISAYDLRHQRTADARVAFAGDVALVSAWLGHAGCETSRHYGRLPDGGCRGSRPVAVVTAAPVVRRERAGALGAQPDQAAGPA